MTETGTTATDPVAHDSHLLELLHALARAQGDQSAAAVQAMRASTTYRANHTGEVSWAEGTMPKRGLLADLPAGTLYYQAKTWTRGDEGYWVRTETGRRLAQLADALELLEPGHRAAVALEAATAASLEARAAVVAHEVHYTGWTRFFLVTSSAGHVHSSMSCSSCHPTTTYAPVVALSDSTAAEAVALLGEALCSVCYPEAPVNGRPSKVTAAAARKLTASA